MKYNNIYKSVLIIADDFTGANDTAAQFSKFGFSAITILKLELLQEVIKKYDVIAIDTESRSVNPKTAYEKLFNLSKNLKEISNILIYKKVDSTLRGNIIEEIKALYHALNPDLIVFAPAYPKQNRTTINGIHMVNGMPLNKTAFGKNLKTPIPSSYIPSLFMQIFGDDYKHVFLEDLRSNNLSNFLNEYRVLSFDIENDNDIESLVKKILKNSNERKIIWVGSAGLAEHLAYNIIIGDKMGKPILIAIGSVNEITRNQVKNFLNEFNAHLILINIKDLIENFDIELKRVINETLEAINSSLDIIITTSFDRKQFNDYEELMFKMNITNLDLGNMLSKKFGELISLIIKEFGWESFKGMFISGGNTAINIISELGIDSITIKGEIEPGISILKYKEFTIVTKAGGFGKEDTLIRAIARIKGILV